MCQLFVNNLNVNCDFECEDNNFYFVIIRMETKTKENVLESNGLMMIN